MARCASRWFPIPPRPTFCHDLIWCLDRPGQELAFYTIKASLWKKNHCVDQRRGKRSLNYCVMLCGSSTDEESVMGPPFLLPLGTFPIWKVVIFSLALWYRQYCLPLSQTFNALESDSQVNTNRPSMGAYSCPQNGILHDSHILQTPSGDPVPALPPSSLWEACDFIHIFGGLNAFILGPQVPRWETLLSCIHLTIVKTSEYLSH